MTELADRLRSALDAVLTVQWSGDRQRMDALHELCQAADLAAAVLPEMEAERRQLIAENARWAAEANRADDLASQLAEMRDTNARQAADDRHLRRLLAIRVGMPSLYLDDGEASGQEHGITIDFMRESVADIDAKLRALNAARGALSSDSLQLATTARPRIVHSCDDPLCAVCGHPWALP